MKFLVYSKKLKPFLIPLLCFFFIQCGGENKTEPPKAKFGRADYDIGQCSQSPFDGESLAPQNFSNEISNSGYFNKDFANSQFQASLKASGASIAETLSQQGVSLYQMSPRKNGNCRYFDFLNFPDLLAQENWNELNPSNEEGSVLLGLFTTSFLKNTQSRKVKIKNPTIMVRQDTQKWTLLHEMSHYLFAKGRAKKIDMPFRSDLQKDVRLVKKTILNLEQRFTKTPIKKIATKIIKNYVLFYKLNHELDIRGPLEEFSIESILLEQASLGKISSINEANDFTNAFRYMLTNSALVTPSYEGLVEQLEKVEKNILESNNWPDLNKKLQDLHKEIVSFLQFIDLRILAANDISKEFIVSEADRINMEEPQQHHHFNLQELKKRHSLFKNWHDTSF